MSMPRRELKPRVKFDSKGRILIPKWIRENLGIVEGTIVEVEIYNREHPKILLTILG